MNYPFFIWIGIWVVYIYHARMLEHKLFRFIVIAGAVITALLVWSTRIGKLP